MEYRCAKADGVGKGGFYHIGNDAPQQGGVDNAENPDLAAKLQGSRGRHTKITQKFCNLVIIEENEAFVASPFSPNLGEFKAFPKVVGQEKHEPAVRAGSQFGKCAHEL
mmetsp:Transcript_14597/g.28578  ORF Transcript_14597/g.28578 Transcript_14597/m.28578 type:complete len:109 (+) Transcript_14597:1624-1950(+)